MTKSILEQLDEAEKNFVKYEDLLDSIPMGLGPTDPMIFRDYEDAKGDLEDLARENIRALIDVAKAAEILKVIAEELEKEDCQISDIYQYSDFIYEGVSALSKLRGSEPHKN